MVENYPKMPKFIRCALMLASLAPHPNMLPAFTASSFLSTLVVVAATPQPKLQIVPVRRHQRCWLCRLLRSLSLSLGSNVLKITATKPNTHQPPATSHRCPTHSAACACCVPTLELALFLFVCDTESTCIAFRSLGV